MTKKHTVCFICLFSLVVVSTGCDGGGPAKPADMPSLFPCTLTFTQEGVPLVGASISLKSSEPGFKWSVGGSSDEEGKAVITTNGVHRGAPAGSYKITVRKTIVLERIGEDLKQADLADPKLKRPETTPLELVIAKGKNDKIFDVGKAVKVNATD